MYDVHLYPAGGAFTIKVLILIIIITFPIGVQWLRDATGARVAVRGRRLEEGGRACSRGHRCGHRTEHSSRICGVCGR